MTSLVRNFVSRRISFYILLLVGFASAFSRPIPSTTTAAAAAAMNNNKKLSSATELSAASVSICPLMEGPTNPESTLEVAMG